MTHKTLRLAVPMAVACGAALAVTPIATAQQQDDAGLRGRLVAVEHQRTLTAEQARRWLADDTFDGSAVKYGVDTYQLVYRTVDARRRPTVASGLLVLPRNGERRLRTVSYAHGTMSHRMDAPSVSTEAWAQGPAVIHAGAGFAAVSPDYLGLGLGPGIHPWKHVPSETTASVDMLRAAREFTAGKGLTLARDVLVTGFSQGASAALGLARALQEGTDPYFRVRAVAPIAGAYDFRGAELPALLEGRVEPKSAVAYTAYLLTSWNRLYGLYGAPSEVFRAPYADRVERYFDGTTPGQEMLQGLPDSVDRLLTERGLALLRTPTGTFSHALDVDAEACKTWTPRIPVRLYRISDDEQAVTANTDHCHAWLRARSVHAPIVDVGERTYYGSRHLGANVAGTAQIVRWFGTLR
ncbi:alpha/beta hydrolase family protein [Thermomonospora cellulosilytica]|uniref:Lipase n=1 Tax=Thermomonospora cellulosilytica TaxID=1411118 RepID=A0A7W3R7J3_9ACTN|nr:lipase [Thermomonospora cellulosilytica]MBA9002579.1 hypothetical protein [Thermomonospora cellulosilytica]